MAEEPPPTAGRDDPKRSDTLDERKATPVTIAWVLGCVVVFLLEWIISGLPFGSEENLALRENAGPVGEAIGRSLAGGGPLVLPVAPFSPNGLMSILLGAISILAVGKLVERTTGSGGVFVAIVLTGSVGAGVGWLDAGVPTLGASTVYYGLLGTIGWLVMKGAIPRSIIWFSWFPFLVLAGIFAYFAEETTTMSHLGHLGAAVAGVAVGAGMPLIDRIGWPLRTLLAIWLAAGTILVGASIAREQEWDLSWSEFSIDRIFGSSKLVLYEDPDGRFRLSHPDRLEPVATDNGLTFRVKGHDDGVVLWVLFGGRSPFYNLDSFVRDRMQAHRESFEGKHGTGAFELIDEREERRGETEARRVTASLRTDRGKRVIIFIYALTERREYEIGTSYDERGGTVEEWVTKMIESLEIVK